MSKTNSVLNFREIIINGIQDLESGVKNKNSGRESSVKLSDSPSLPQFAFGDNQLTAQQQQFINAQGSKQINDNNSQILCLDNQQMQKIEIQQFKKPTFINPVQQKQTQKQKGQLTVKLNLNDINRANYNYSKEYSNQKENLKQESERAFIENSQQNRSMQYLKWINSPILEKDYIQTNTKNNTLILSNRVKDESQMQKSDTSFSGVIYNNEKEETQNYGIDRLSADQSIQSYSLLTSRMEQKEDGKESSYYQDFSQSISKKQNGNSRNQYFCIHDDPNKDREQIIKTLSQHQNELLNMDSQSRSGSKQKKILQNNSINYNKNNESNNLQNFTEYRQSNFKMNSSQQSIKLNDQKEVISRSSSYKKEVSFSPKKINAFVQFKKNKLKERFPSQTPFSHTLRSYSPNNKILSADYVINKTNLKKMVLHFESEKIRGLYDLTAFIKLFLELGMMKVKYSDKFQVQKEIQQVEELWRLLKFSSYSAECVSTCFIYQILLIILDSKIHQLDQAANLIDVLCKREYEKYSGFFEKQRKDCQIWLTSALVEGIRDSLQYTERNEEIFEDSEKQHKKNQNKKSRYDKLFDHTEYLKTDINDRTPLKERNIYKEKVNQIKGTPNRLKLKSVQANDENEIYVENSVIQNTIQRQEQNNSFYINNAIENNNVNNQQNEDLSTSQLNVAYKKQFDQDEYSKQVNVHNRLYKSSFKQIQTTSTNNFIKEQTEQEKLQECTFKPKINKNTDKIIQRSISNIKLSKNNCGQQIQNEEQTIQQQVRGVKQNLQRMEQARQQKQYKEQFWENQRIKYQNTRSRSPVFQNRQLKDFKEINSRSPSPHQNVIRETIQKEKPMLYVDINISKGKSGKIAFYQGDQPEQVADNFAKIHNITESAKQKLINNLKNILSEYYSQLYEKF